MKKVLIAYFYYSICSCFRWNGLCKCLQPTTSWNIRYIRIKSFKKYQKEFSILGKRNFFCISSIHQCPQIFASTRHRRNLILISSVRLHITESDSNFLLPAEKINFCNQLPVRVDMNTEQIDHFRFWIARIWWFVEMSAFNMILVTILCFDVSKSNGPALRSVWKEAI